MFKLSRSRLCVVCAKWDFPFSRLWHNIIMSTNTGNNPMKCSICEKTYRPDSSSADPQQPSTAETSSDGAAMGSSSTTDFQGSDRPYKCSVCNKTFRHLSELSRHERVHTGEKPYKCDTCEKTFSQASHLAHHQRTHSADRPYKCAVCEKTFKHRQHLVRHMYAHSGEHLFKCNLCELHFKESSELLHHQCQPAGERPFRLRSMREKLQTALGPEATRAHSL